MAKMSQVIGSNNCIDLHKFPYSPNLFDLMDREGVLPTEGLSKADKKNARTGCSRLDRLAGDLCEREF